MLEMYHWQVQKYLDLPYSFKGPNYDIESDARTGYACKKIIECYQKFRSLNEQTLLLVCDLTDFQVFSAAMVLVIHDFKIRELTLDELPDSDWNIIHELSKTLNCIIARRNYEITRQAVDVLAYFWGVYSARRSPPEAGEIVVPYFGKISVTPPGSTKL
jgi:hypothetical protein